MILVRETWGIVRAIECLCGDVGKKVFFYCFPGKIVMFLMWEKHWEFVGAKVMCQVMQVRSFFYHFRPANIIMCLLCEKHWEKLRAKLMWYVKHVSIVLFNCFSL